MSSTIDAIHDDEDEWNYFCSKNGADSRWTLYSREYRHAIEQNNKYGYTGRELRLAVAHAIQRDDLTTAQANEWKELKHLMELERKYQ